MITPLVVLSLVFFAVRVVPRRFFSKNGHEYMSSDKWVHLYYAQLFRDNRHRWIEKWPRTDIAGPLRLYPPLFHLLLSFVAKDTLLKYEQYITTLLQYVIFLIVIACSSFLAERLGLGPSLMIGLAAGATYCFLPILFGPNSGMVFCTARPFGAVFSNAFMIALYFFSIDRSPAAALACVAAFFLSAVSSRFSVQTIVFAGAVYGILLRDPAVLAVLAGSVFLTLTLGFKTYRPILKYHFRHLVIYKTVFMKGTTDMLEKHGSVLSHVGKALASFREKRFRDVAQNIYNSSAMRIILMNPFAILVLAAGAAAFSTLRPEIGNLWILLASAFIVTVLTATSSLKFLGEAERYLEFGAIFPVCFLSGYFCSTPLFLGLWAAAMLYSAIFSLLSFRLHPMIDGQKHRELYGFLNTLGEKKIITFPMYCYSTILHLSDMTVPYMEGWQLMKPYYHDVPALEARWSYLYGLYPGPNTVTLEGQIRDFGIDYVLYCRNESAPNRREALLRELGKFPVVFDNADYIVYSAQGINHGAGA